MLGAAGRQEPHPLLERDELLVGAALVLESFELLHQPVAAELLLELRRRDGLPLGGLDLLGHPLERLEGALVRQAGHGLLDALLRLGPLGARHQDVLLPLGLFDLVVELPERELELLGLRLVLEPGLVQLLRALEVLVVAEQRLLGEVVAPLLHREHRAALPVFGLPLHAFGIGLELFLVRDGGGHLLLGLGELTLHVDDQLVQHLLRVFGPGDQVVEVGPDHRGQAIEDSHRRHPSRYGASAPRCVASASVIESKLASNSEKSRSASSSASVSTMWSPSRP